MSSVGDLETILSRELSLRPGQNAAQLAASLKADGIPASTNRVLSILRSSEIFTQNDGGASTWRAVSVEYLAEDWATLDELSGLEAQVHPPRDWQISAQEAWEQAGYRGVVEAVTGAGKSLLGVYAARDALRAGGRVWVLTPTIDLVRQWIRLLSTAFPDIPVGQFGDGTKDTFGSHPIVVSSIQSAHKQRFLCPPVIAESPNLLIADECHTYGAAKYSLGLDRGFRRRLGLTATYGRGDLGEKFTLNPYFGGVVYHLGYKEAIASGAVAEFVVSLVGVDLKPSESEAYSVVMEDMAKAKQVLVREYGVHPGDILQAAAQMCGGYRVPPKAQRAARTYMTKFNERKRILGSSDSKMEVLQRLSPMFDRSEKAIIFCQTVETSTKAEGILQDLFFDARAYTSQLDKRARKRLLADFASPDGVRILCAPKVLDEGIDVPAADVGVILAASQSQRQMIQRMGRVIRPKADGRLAQFVILYIRGSNEDPSTGAHETFLDEILESASSIDWYDDTNIDTLVNKNSG